MRRSLIACLLIAAATVLASAGEARANDQDGRLRFQADGVWSVSGNLDAVRPGNRSVRVLYVDHLGPGTAKGLAPLTAFKELRHLEIDVVAGVDLGPLTELNLETLVLRYVREVDLTPLGAMPNLETLMLVDLRDVLVPSTMALAPSLSSLTVMNVGWKETSAPVKALIDAIDWSRLGGLRSLGLDVGGDGALEPITVDLGILRSLPRLVDLRIDSGVHHRGALPSPLAPPFDGLPAGLRSVRIDAWRPAAVRRALQRRYPRAYVGVTQRVPHDPRNGSWMLYQPERGIPDWSTYGSLWEAFDGRYGLTENAALLAARRRLRRVAPALLRRLEFDSEADGTGISARRRRDLERTLRVLGIRSPPARTA